MGSEIVLVTVVANSNTFKKDGTSVDVQSWYEIVELI